MTNSVNATFRECANAYWAKSLSVIPVEKGSKAPPETADLKKWPSYCHQLPSDKVRALWLQKYGDCGVGFLLGMEVRHGLRLVGIDVDDDQSVRLAKAIVGSSPCAKHGKKGLTIFALAEPSLKSTSFKDATSAHKIDILASGRMTVVPPSIHPETEKPYEWVGTPLLEANFDDFPVFTKAKLNLLKAVICSEHTSGLWAGNTTHDAGLALTGLLVQSQCSDEQIYAIVKALLPENYDGDSLKELQEWIDSARKKGYDKEDSKNGPLIAIASELSQCELFHDVEEVAYVTFVNKHGAKITREIDSSSGKSWLRQKYYKATGEALKSQPLTDLVGALVAKAVHEGGCKAIYLRIAEHDNVIYIDVGDEIGSVVRITSDDWDIVKESPVKFFRPKGYKALPLPEKGGNTRLLKELLHLPEDVWVLVLAFLISAINPKGPYFHSMIEGEHGSGKSFVTAQIKSLIDPATALKTMLPRNERDLMVMARIGRVLSFDNLSKLTGSMSDALCVLATGGGLVTRGLFTNAEPFIFNSARPVVMNGITSIIDRPDLMDRTLPIFLPSIEEGKRKPEEDLFRELEQATPKILGGLYDIVSTALRNRDEVIPPTTVRMADCMKWLVAAEPATGFPSDTFVDAVNRSQTDFVAEQMATNTLALALREFLARQRPPGKYEGHVGKLYKLLVADVYGKAKDAIGATDAYFSGNLRRLKRSLKTVGIEFEIGKHDRVGSPIRVWWTEELPPL